MKSNEYVIVYNDGTKDLVNTYGLANLGQTIGRSLDDIVMISPKHFYQNYIDTMDDGK